MYKLTHLENSLLSKDVLKGLIQNKISNILEFLQEDTEKLTTITKLNLSQILEIRNDIFAKYSAPLFDGSSLLEKSKSSKSFLNTGIESLDIALNGGLSIGYITEIFGLAGSGKTQLCYQLAINCSRNTENTILYLDTKGDFSALRIQKILENLGCSHQEMARILYKIKIMRIWTMEEMIEIFKKLKNKVINIEKLSLIIIDSLPCLMFQHFGDENKIGLTYLNILVNLCRYLGKHFQISLVCVNILTRWVERDFVDCVDDEEQEKDISSVERHNRCLGKYWRYIPSHIVLLEKLKLDHEDAKNNAFSVKATVTRNDGLKIPQQCMLSVDSFGVR